MEAVAVRGTSWTTEEIEALRQHWTEGKTAAVIATLLGKSRSAVMGKIFRLRLDAGPAKESSPPGRAAPDGTFQELFTPVRRRRSPLRLKRQPVAQPQPTPHKALLGLTNNSCRWPHGRPGTDRFFFCGEPEADLQRGIPYCARHMRRAYPGSGATANALPAKSDADSPRFAKADLRRFGFPFDVVADPRAARSHR